jgi:hypothetical protein
MMKNFDNEEKQAEAAEKRRLAAAEKAGKGQTPKDTQKRLDDIHKTKLDILKRQGEIMQKAIVGGSNEIPEEFEAEFMELASQLKYLNSQAHEILMRTDAEYRRSKTPLVSAHKKAPTAAELVAPKPEPQAPEVVTKKLPDQLPKAEDKPSSRIPKVEPKKPTAKAEGGGEFKYKPHPKGTPEAVVRDERTGKLVGKMKDGSIVWLDEVKG